MARQFEARPATRERVPLWVGIIGPSGTGKTYSALRLATGMSKIYGDGVFLIDTEARRALHYADGFRFSHVDFKPPFGPLDYLAAIEHCISKGAKTIVVDSMSHEWEGEGGVLQMHDAETDRLAEKWHTSPEKAQMGAWQKPKGEHARLRSRMIQSGLNFVLCYRAKEKLKIVRGKDPVALGWQPIGGDDMVYEATVNILLAPGAGGIPQWNPVEDGEKAMVKLPGQFKVLFAQRRPLDEETGVALASWAAGGAAPPADGARPARPAAVASSAAPSPPADPAALEMLEAQLGANGLKTKKDRGEWFQKIVGRWPTAAAPPTEDEIRLCIERAEQEAAA